MLPHMVSPILMVLRIIGVVIGIWAGFEELYRGNSLEAIRMVSVWTVASVGIISGIGNCFFNKDVAESLGWRTGSNFQKELGFMHFAFALTALIVFFFRVGPQAEVTLLIPYMLYYLQCALLHLWNAIHFRRYTWQTITSTILIFIMIAYISFFIVKSSAL